MTHTIVTDTPSETIRRIRIPAADIIEFINDKMDDKGLPDNATLFVVTAKNDGAKKPVRKAIRKTETSEIYLEIPFIENAEGERVAIRGRGDKS